MLEKLHTLRSATIRGEFYWMKHMVVREREDASKNGRRQCSQRWKYSSNHFVSLKFKSMVEKLSRPDNQPKSRSTIQKCGWSQRIVTGLGRFSEHSYDSSFECRSSCLWTVNGEWIFQEFPSMHRFSLIEHGLVSSFRLFRWIWERLWAWFRQEILVPIPRFLTCTKDYNLFDSCYLEPR